MITQDLHQRRRENLPQWWTDLGPAATPKLFNRLTSVINTEALQNWLHQPNSAFAERTPASLVRGGDTSPLEKMAYELESGTPS